VEEAVMTLQETIREATRKHLLENNGLLYGQCVSAVGWVAGTVPELTEDQGIIELPTSDASNGGIVCGAALMGRRPIYVCRYQGFMWYNAVSLVNYAAKSKQMWDVPCPVFIRSIGMEGHIGPVASHMHHSMIMRMPGINVFAPMTPGEWTTVWNYYLEGDDPVYCSEHRLSYQNNQEYQHVHYAGDYICIVAIGAARLEAVKAVEQLKINHGQVCNLIHTWSLKPFTLSSEELLSLHTAKRVIVFDSDYTICGASEHIAYQISQLINRPVEAYGIEDRVAGFSEQTDIRTPSAEFMVEKVLGR
jgi:pyruvate dehydrogenase E1 component beta subunit/2-oxoisovalerate dehydrogenase E1 component beta subunit